jgi:sulfur relay (sulfurtransferase) DsrC/TusE family protein
VESSGEYERSQRRDREVLMKTFRQFREEITRSDLQAIEKYADKLFAKVGIDVEFTRHFLDRVNDERNKKQITQAELIRLFKQTYAKHGKKIAQLGPDAQAVITDMMTDVNMPFVLNWDKQSQELDLVAKTVMRKKNFKTPNQKLEV